MMLARTLQRRRKAKHNNVGTHAAQTARQNEIARAFTHVTRNHHIHKAFDTTHIHQLEPLQVRLAQLW